MARTYRSLAGPALPEQVSEGRNGYQVSVHSGGKDWVTRLSGRSTETLPVEVEVGGERHGISFLARLKTLDGIDLPRPPLIEARFLHSATEKRLVLSPGFSTSTPASLESGIGRVLSGKFEKKCLACHGAPESSPLNEPGVHCETCHGPGQDHLLAVGKGKPREGILNPARMGNARSVEVCATCHSGFMDVTDPLPDDLLISSQATALRNTECYIQSGAGMSCTSCHDPHRNAKANEPVYTETCLLCHSAAVTEHAALCPVNKTDGCIGCHMPKRKRGPFQMVDHWIRVVDEPAGGRTPSSAASQTRVTPVRVFLRVMSVKDQSLAADLDRQLRRGASFFDLATKYSTDPSASNGGYLGEVKTAEMEAGLRAAVTGLQPGGITSVLTREGSYVIFGRLPRDFRWRAGELAEVASTLRGNGRLEEAATKYLEALRSYPGLLRAMILLGVTEGQLGRAQQAYGILDLAKRLYPEDPAAHYNLGIALESLGRPGEAIDMYRRAIGIEPDLLPAYLNLGGALFASGQSAGAVDAYRSGLNVNPLSAELYFNLAQVLQQQGKAEEAGKALALAKALNPQFVASQTAATR